MGYNFCEQLSRSQTSRFTGAVVCRIISALVNHVSVRTTLSWLNRQAIASHITNDMRHDAGDSNIIQGFTFNRLAIFGYQ